MERQDFRNAIVELFKYFRYQSIPDDEIIWRWHSKVNFIPIVALGWIVERIQELESLPRNLPKLIKGLWFDYRRENTHKTTAGITDCKGCENNGFFIVAYENKIYYPPLKCTMIVLCSECSNWSRHFGQKQFELCARMSRDDIEVSGFKILDMDGVYAGRKLKDNIHKYGGQQEEAKKVATHLNPNEPKVGTRTYYDDFELPLEDKYANT